MSDAEATKPVPLPAMEAPRSDTPGRHLVVVLTRAARPEDQAPGAVLVSRFWHPRDRRWSRNFFESLDHAVRLFVDETGWTLIQNQRLSGEHEYELIFEARLGDFQVPSTEEILKEVGLNPTDVKELLEGDQ